MSGSHVSAAEDKLRRWADMNASRDEVVREAVRAGVTIRQIQEITGIGRTAIMQILARGTKRPQLRLISSD
ncbi:MAG TPA: hypothetical protein VMV17_18740 [Streptosporangiaceae bacterium]|nr:hypothetical protein [Streptosporangiaceae bacterium]